MGACRWLLHAGPLVLGLRKPRLPAGSLPWNRHNPAHVAFGAVLQPIYSDSVRLSRKERLLHRHHRHLGACLDPCSLLQKRTSIDVFSRCPCKQPPLSVQYYESAAREGVRVLCTSDTQVALPMRRTAARPPTPVASSRTRGIPLPSACGRPTATTGVSWTSSRRPAANSSAPTFFPSVTTAPPSAGSQ